MNTFLVDFVLVQNFQYLDNKRLGKQRVECRQILNTLEGKSKGWRHHPAVLMWAGHEDLLRLYMDYCIHEWVRRGFKNGMALNYEWERPERYKQVNDTHTGMIIGHWLSCKSGPFQPPKWWGDSRVLISHRANLLRKDPDHYSQFKWQALYAHPETWKMMPYYWPVTKEQVVLKDILQFCP